jgi:Flp pilus assembly protein TadG
LHRRRLTPTAFASLTPTRRLVDRRARGQAVVEFALVFTIFVTMLMGFLEFAFVFNALLSVGHATRDAALTAAEAGNNSGADCVILAQVEKDVTAPAAASRITQVVIYRSDQNGAVYGGQQNVYARTGSTSCAMSDGTTLTVPYSVSGSPTYLPATRCNVQAGCGSGHPSVDTIGVMVAYQHTWVTPLANLVALGGTGTTLTQSNAMRMEPVL